MMKLSELQSAMVGCEQMPGVSIMNHGLAVHRKYLDLFDCLKNIDDHPGEFRFPSWFSRYAGALYETQAEPNIAMWYCRFHDCGKPACRVEGPDGKVSFPDHAMASSLQWKRTDMSPWLNDLQKERVSQLILQDMLIHIIKTPAEVAEFAKLEDAPTLLIVGLAELHANAEMFGGIESQGFKIKFSQIERRGKAVCSALWDAK